MIFENISMDTVQTPFSDLPRFIKSVPMKKVRNSRFYRDFIGKTVFLRLFSTPKKNFRRDGSMVGGPFLKFIKKITFFPKRKFIKIIMIQYKKYLKYDKSLIFFSLLPGQELGGPIFIENIDEV